MRITESAVASISPDSRKSGRTGARPFSAARLSCANASTGTRSSIASIFNPHVIWSTCTRRSDTPFGADSFVR